MNTTKLVSTVGPIVLIGFIVFVLYISAHVAGAIIGAILGITIPILILVFIYYGCKWVWWYINEDFNKEK